MSHSDEYVNELTRKNHSQGVAIAALTAENKDLRALLSDMLGVDSFKYQDKCCDECDEEQSEIRQKVRAEAKQILKKTGDQNDPSQNPK